MIKRILRFLICLVVIGVAPYKAAAASYTDVSNSAWYVDAVNYVTEHGIMQGTGNNRFSPDEILTRGQFVTLLYRMVASYY